MGKPTQYFHPTTGKRWHCLRADRVVEVLPEFTPEEHLKALHAALESTGGVVWSAARRWFEMQPMVPPPDYDQVDLYSFATADELETSLGLKRGGLRQELSAVMGIWTAAKPKEDERKRIEQAAQKAKEETFTGELPLQDPEEPDKVIAEAGFGRVFTGDGVNKLSVEELAAEKKWMASRIHAWRRPLNDSQVASLARAILVKEVLMRRMEARLLGTDMSIAGKEATEFIRQLTSEQAAYAQLLNQLDELAPWMSAVSGRVTLQGVVADVIRIMQEYGVTRDKTVVDGFFTATEVQILMNGSKQLSDPQYRPDIVVMVAEAKRNLWNRDWSDSLTAGQYKRLRTAWAAAERECRQNLTVEESDPVPDFMDEGPAGEFPAIVTPAQA
jgi:hypothetical protein